MNLVSDIQRTIDYIEENIHDELESVEIAKQVYMSAFHFQKIFSFVCGITLGEYIRNRRLSLSKDELMITDKSILNISIQYVYKTPEGFIVPKSMIQERLFTIEIADDKETQEINEYIEQSTTFQKAKQLRIRQKEPLPDEDMTDEEKAAFEKKFGKQLTFF